MAAPILLLQDIHLNFGRTTVLDGAELSVSEGERLCLVGRNGSGKSTLLKIAAGLMEADGGTRFAQPGATIRYLRQQPTDCPEEKRAAPPSPACLPLHRIFCCWMSRPIISICRRSNGWRKSFSP